MKTLIQFTAAIFLASHFSLSIGQHPIIIDNNCTDYTQIPGEWITKAKDSLHIYYGHTSHGSQLTSGGMTALENYFGDTYAYGTSADDGSILYFEDSYDGQDITAENWIQPTKDYLAAHEDCNVVMWSWCSFGVDADHVNAYIDSMETLITDYPDVKFVFFTGHNDDGATEAVVRNRKTIIDHCIANNRILYDFTALEAYNPDGNFFGDWDTTTNLLADINDRYNLDENTAYNMEGASTPVGNWGNEWQTVNPDSPLTALAQIDVCTICAHSSESRLHCVLKGAAVWWMAAVLVGWDDGGTSSGGSVPVYIEQSNSPDIKMFPNPTTDGIITLYGQRLSNAHIQVFNVLGKEIYSEKINGTQTIINLSGNAKGTYFTVLHSGTYIEVRKVLLQ